MGSFRRRLLSAMILVALAALAAATSVPTTGPVFHPTLIWDSQTRQWKDACAPVQLVPVWMCIPPDEWGSVTWDEAIGLLYGGRVDSGAQFHNLTVILVLKNGTIVQTREPAIDQIFRDLEKCGDPCKGVSFGTE